MKREGEGKHARRRERSEVRAGVQSQAEYDVFSSRTLWVRTEKGGGRWETAERSWFPLSRWEVAGAGSISKLMLAAIGRWNLVRVGRKEAGWGCGGGG